MYIFYFEFFDDFEKRKFKIIKKFKIKNVHIANESCYKYEKISLKNTLYFERSKKDKFTKFSDQLIGDSWMENVRLMLVQSRRDWL
jgi:hypothetical protein